MPGAAPGPDVTRFAAILVMAGRGERFGGARAKVFLDLGGKAVWRHAAETLLGTPGCERLVLVTSPGAVTAVGDEARAAGLANAIVVAGGARRQDSVRAGLAEVADDVPVVAVHDAARPLVTRDTVLRVVRAAALHGAAIAASRVRDTVKRVDADGRVVATEDRTRLWLAETPQAFRTGALRDAHAKARDAGVEVTDDAALIERGGGLVLVVESAGWNPKITVPSDLERVARSLACTSGGSEDGGEHR